MKTAIATAIVSGLLAKVYTLAVPPIGYSAPSGASLEKRDLISNIISPPQGTVTCLGHDISLNDIEEALSQGTRLAGADPPIAMGKGDYPHVFGNNPENILFENCNGIPLYEYPVLRNRANPWVPGKNTRLSGDLQPDRVIFSPQGTDTATYCGTITHDPAIILPNGSKGFSRCTE